MRLSSKVLLSLAGAVIVTLAVWRGLYGYGSTTFAGPAFHGRPQDSADVSKVTSDLSRHLDSLGFNEAQSPSTIDSWAGMHSEGSTRRWYVRGNPGKRAMWVAVDASATQVDTSLKWESYGMKRTRQAWEGDAYRLALQLDDWFRGRSEVNQLPSSLVDQKRDWFTERLAEPH